MRREERRHEDVLDRRRVVDDLVIPRRRRRRGRRPLPPVERALSRQRMPPIARPAPLRPSDVGLPRRHREQRVIPQHVVVVEILVPAGEREHPLAHQLRDGVLDQGRGAMICEAGRKPLQQPAALGHLAE